MLRGLVLENFKAFGGRRTIPVRPLTLIFGPNSAGKSAILQSLLLLRQSIDDLETSSLPVRPKGRLVDLGSFREMVFRHDLERRCEITPLLDSRQVQSKRIPSVAAIQETVGNLSSDFGLGVRISHSPVSQTTRLDPSPLYLGDGADPIALMMNPAEVANDLWNIIGAEREVEAGAFTKSFLVSPSMNRDHRLWADLFHAFESKTLPRFIGLLEEEVDSGDRFYQFHLEKYSRDVYLDETLAREKLDWYREYNVDRYRFDLQFESMMHRLYFRSFLLDELKGKGPVAIRGVAFEREDFPSIEAEAQQRDLRAFLLDNQPPGHMPNLADLALEMSSSLRSMLDRLIYVGPLRDYPERHYLFSGSAPVHVGPSGELSGDLLLLQPELLERTNKTLAAFGVGYQLQVQRLQDHDGGPSDVYALRLVDERMNMTANLRDVGFGVSQVLPVLVQALVGQQNTILVEQPELHLHPRLQAELADVFIEAALGGRGNTFMLETHSEHLVLRVMRRLRDTSRGTLPDGLPALRPDDVSIIYVHPTENGSVPLVMDLDVDGSLLSAWPNGFFEEGFHERFA